MRWMAWLLAMFLARSIASVVFAVSWVLASIALPFIAVSEWWSARDARKSQEDGTGGTVPTDDQ